MDSKAWFNINSAPYIPQICRKILWPKTATASGPLDRYGMQHLWTWNERLYVSRKGICGFWRLVLFTYIEKQQRTRKFLPHGYGSALKAATTARTLFIDSREPDTLTIRQNFRQNKASPGAIEAGLYLHYSCMAWMLLSPSFLMIITTVYSHSRLRFSMLSVIWSSLYVYQLWSTLMLDVREKIPQLTSR